MDEINASCVLVCVDELVDMGLVIEVFGVGVVMVCEMFALLGEIDV